MNTAILTAVSIGWLLALSLGAARLLKRSLGEHMLIGDRKTGATLIAASLLLAVGLTWGLPGPSWAPDEVDPPAVRNALAHRFANGWHDKYPPFHYGVLALSAAPVLVAERFELADAEGSDDLLTVQFRLVSLAMAIGCLVLAGVLGSRVRPDTSRWLVVLCAAAFLPFPYYAKTANLDVPYAFWVLLSFVWLADAHARGATRDFVGFGVAAALAVATKDQAYGFYLLPVVHLVLATRRAGPAALAAAAGFVAFALAHNAFVNPSGFVAHVDALIGPASANYRMFPLTPVGQAGLAAATFECLSLGLGWAGGLVLVAALARPRSRPPAWMSLAILSYYLTFIVPAGYVYDRFLLPALLLLAPFAAAGAHELAAGARRRWVGGALASALVSVLVWRAVSVDVLLFRDSRYAAEAWLSANVPPGATVGYVSQPLYLPRLAPFDEQALTPSIEATVAEQPDFIVVNTEWLRRFEPGSPRRLWLEWLERATGPYRQVFRHKDPLRGTTFAWTRRFTDRVEDPLTNLDKANPEIAIFRRTADR